MHVMNNNWSATKQRLHPQSVAKISRHSVLLGQDLTMWDIVWVSPQRHRLVSLSRHFLLQAPQCPCSMRKRFSRDHCCRRRSKPGCRIVGSHTRWELTTEFRLPVMPPSTFDLNWFPHWWLANTFCSIRCRRGKVVGKFFTAEPFSWDVTCHLFQHRRHDASLACHTDHSLKCSTLTARHRIWHMWTK